MRFHSMETIPPELGEGNAVIAIFTGIPSETAAPATEGGRRTLVLRSKSLAPTPTRRLTLQPANENQSQRDALGVNKEFDSPLMRRKKQATQRKG